MGDAPAALSERITVLLIGGSGFIGMHLVHRLERDNVTIRLLTRRSASNFPAHVEIVHGDLKDEAALAIALKGVHTVYHLANPTGSSWQDYLDRMVNPTINLAYLAQWLGVVNFFFISSVDLYDSSRPNVRIAGETPADPKIDQRNHYARAKHACEVALKRLGAASDMQVTIFRIGLTIGKGASPAHRGVGHFDSLKRVRLWGTGRYKLPFILVEDVADALALALRTPELAQRTLLICAPPILTAKDYMKAVAARARSTIFIIPYAIWLFWAADLLREGVKHLIRHPNRRRPSLHDWHCRAHRADYDPLEAKQLLGWEPAHDRQSLIARGVNPAVDEFINGVAVH